MKKVPPPPRGACRLVPDLMSPAIICMAAIHDNMIYSSCCSCCEKRMNAGRSQTVSALITDMGHYWSQQVSVIWVI